MSVGAVWRRILVPIQFSRRLPGAELELARSIARTNHAKIVLLHVVPLSSAVSADASLAAQYFMEAEKDAQLKLRKIAQSKLKSFDVEIVVEVGNPATRIVTQAAKLHADLLIIATHGRTGIKRYLLGSVAEHLVARCPCPLLTIRPRNEH
ncbi:MAG TPA: universal stress protein [Candidatus Binataceae bacterium]